MTETLIDQSPAQADQAPQTANELLRMRSEWLDAQLNPDGTLPEVSITPPARYGNYILNDADSKPMGSYSLTYPNTGSGEEPYARVGSTGLDHAHIHQGYGKASYLAMMKALPLGIGLESGGGGLTEDSMRIWKWLESHGVASALHNPEDEVIDVSTQHYMKARFRTTLPFNELPQKRESVAHDATELSTTDGKRMRVTRLLRRFL